MVLGRFHFSARQPHNGSPPYSSGHLRSIATASGHCGYCINTPAIHSVLPTFPSIYPYSSHAPFTRIFALSCPLMKARQANKSKHPATPIMSPAQLAAAGISQPKTKKPRKQTKDQRLATLEEDLCATRCRA